MLISLLPTTKKIDGFNPEDFQALADAMEITGNPDNDVLPSTNFSQTARKAFNPFSKFR
ncbi:MAG: hypothetical protein SFT90_01900 [Rickettsiales bacterium]|nr:hypothetical protein [Rickettsiales bacterium]